MFKFCLLVITALVLGGQAVRERLVGAKIADIGEFPYQVSVRIGGNQFCGGALISKKHVLTAAHCIADAKAHPEIGDVTVVVGTNSITSGGATYPVVAATQHPSYVHKHEDLDWMYDIGVLTLGSEVELTKLVGLAKLPTSEVKAGSKAVVTGWGTMDNPTTPPSQVLRKLNVNILDQASCQSKMPSNITIQSSHVCAFSGQENTGACSGDSGGPLAQNGVVIGVVSGGVPCALGFPDIYTDVYQYLSFVKGVMDQ